MTTNSSIVVDSSCPYASQAAISIMQAGGTAVDAAIAASAVLFVTLPMCCGPGGDLAAICFDSATQTVLSHSALGRIPAKASYEEFSRRGYLAIPLTGIVSATVPAAVEGLVSLQARLGTLPLNKLFRPAINAAQSGVTVNAQMHRWIRNNLTIIEGDPICRQLFLPGGKVIAVGATLKQPQLAGLLSNVAENGYRFLRGEEYQNALLRFSAEQNGLFSGEDFKVSQVDIQEPATLSLGALTVHTTPAPSQGVLLLRSLAMYDYLTRIGLAENTNKIHLWSEILHRVFRWRLDHLSQDISTTYSSAWMEIEADCAKINLTERSEDFDYPYHEGDTTHFVVADHKGNSVSMILSLSLGFGSGVIEPSTGIIFNNRLGRSVSMVPIAAYLLKPGQRPINTIHTYAVTSAQGLLFMGGTPGGYGQVQWNATSIAAAIFDHIPLADIVRAPRFTCFPPADLNTTAKQGRIELETDLTSQCTQLKELGHTVRCRKRVGGSVRLVENSPQGWETHHDGHDTGAALATQIVSRTIANV